MKTRSDTEITGYMKLRLWVSALDHDDMDLCVKLEKCSVSAEKVGFHIALLA